MKDRMPSGVVPIADASCGNKICISLKKSDFGSVYFWDHEFEAEEGTQPDFSNLSRISNNFEDFWNSMKSFEADTVEVDENAKIVWVDNDFLKSIK